jgi:hypothetical protein
MLFISREWSHAEKNAIKIVLSGKFSFTGMRILLRMQQQTYSGNMNVC